MIPLQIYCWQQKAPFKDHLIPLLLCEPMWNRVEQQDKFISYGGLWLNAAFSGAHRARMTSTATAKYFICWTWCPGTCQKHKRLERLIPDAGEGVGQAKFTYLLSEKTNSRYWADEAQNLDRGREIDVSHVIWIYMDMSKHLPKVMC